MKKNSFLSQSLSGKSTAIAKVCQYNSMLRRRGEDSAVFQKASKDLAVHALHSFIIMINSFAFASESYFHCFSFNIFFNCFNNFQYNTPIIVSADLNTGSHSMGMYYVGFLTKRKHESSNIKSDILKK